MRRQKAVTAEGGRAPLPWVQPGQDVWLVKYPSIKPSRAKITAVTSDVSIAVLYNDSGMPDHARKQYLKFPAPKAISACEAFTDEPSAIAAWNAKVMAAIADATESYKTQMRMLESRLITNDGKDDSDEA